MQRSMPKARPPSLRRHGKPMTWVTLLLTRLSSMFSAYSLKTSPHVRLHHLSQHIHRVGYHYPSTVVAAACLDLGLYLTTTGKAVSLYPGGSSNLRHRSNSEISQIAINTEARDVLRDLFPNIPDNDINQIIKTSFQKVGSLPTRNQA